LYLQHQSFLLQNISTCRPSIDTILNYYAVLKLFPPPITHMTPQPHPKCSRGAVTKASNQQLHRPSDEACVSRCDSSNLSSRLNIRRGAAPLTDFTSVFDGSTSKLEINSLRRNIWIHFYVWVLPLFAAEIRKGGSNNSIHAASL